MRLDRSWSKLADRLRELAEGSADWSPDHRPEDSQLVGLALVRERGDLTAEGQEYYLARFVRENTETAATALGAALKKLPLVAAFCEPLWAAGDVPVAGAVSLLKRVTGSADQHSAQRWLELMNAGRVVAYNRNRKTMRVLFNPIALVPQEEEADRERTRGHVISPDTPFTNIIALRDLLRAARGDIRWYEPHLPGKALEVLAREVSGEGVDSIRLLSGPANATGDLKDDYKRFRSEMRSKRGVNVEWRILTKKEAANHHDRVFFAEGMARNIPPLNSILKGSTGEILESGIGPGKFESWWALGEDLREFQPSPAA